MLNAVEVVSKSDEILSSIEIPDRSTFFQMKNFIIGKEPTVHGQLWAVIRNLKDKRENIDLLEMQIEESEDNIKLIDVEIGLTNSTEISHIDHSVIKLLQEKKDIEIRKLERKKKSILSNIDKLKNKIKYVLEEMNYFLQAYETLVSAAGGVKCLDDYDLQCNYWNEKLLEELNINILLGKPLNSDFVHTVMSLEEDLPVKKCVTNLLQNTQNALLQKNEKSS